MLVSMSYSLRTYRAFVGGVKKHRRVTRSHRQQICCTSEVKRKLVFLGTPQVAANVLDRLFDASEHPSASFQIAAVVSQPGRPRGRGNRSKPQPSPVEALALSRGLAADQIFCPLKASEVDFLKTLGDIAPDLCLTAAYGNILPKAFLEIPKHGTLNIHPSLLPKYRGAAPVQRALQDGVKETGVSVAFTVRAMDAGPVLAQSRVSVDPEIQAPELLDLLFDRGADLLLEKLPHVWSGKAAEAAVKQDDSAMSHAAKMTKEEGVLDFREDAQTLHNKIRAFAGWPGTTANLSIQSQDAQAREESIKVIRAAIFDAAVSEVPQSRPAILVQKAGVKIFCGKDEQGGVLDILEVQPVGKKAMGIAAFVNGLNRKTVRLSQAD